MNKMSVKLYFCSLSSGSSGNCYYLGNEFHGILIDPGISATSICRFQKGIDISMQSIIGVLITRNHIDHIKGLEQFTRKNYLPAFTTRKIWESILTPKKNSLTVSVKFLYGKNSIWQALI